MYSLFSWAMFKEEQQNFLFISDLNKKASKGIVDFTMCLPLIARRFRPGHICDYREKTQSHY